MAQQYTFDPHLRGQARRKCCPSANRGQIRSLATMPPRQLGRRSQGTWAAQMLVGGSPRNRAGLRRIDLPSGLNASQRGQSLARRAASKTCGSTPKSASPQDTAGFLCPPPSEFSSSPPSSANEPSQTLHNHDLGAEIPGISAGLQVPTQPLRPPRARNSVSNALPSHSDPT